MAIEYKPTTTDAGIPVESQENSLTVGPNGPILLIDHYLIEQMANFNRERTPERQPHAKGSGAFGTFEVTNDVSAFTKAAVFQPNTETPMLARFSTVAGERGRPDVCRDVRGSALEFSTPQGIEFLTQAEADYLAGTDPDYHTKDLFQAVERGDYPTWNMRAQIMPFEEAKTYRFNPFDLTKVWPHADYPLIDVGRFTLNRNATDNHSEIELAAFDVSNMVPGIGPSPDRMLQGRMFSYADAHRARIGANYIQLPVNSPVAPVNACTNDVPMRYNKGSDPVYWPNS